jgi:hypothetical protein
MQWRPPKNAGILSPKQQAALKYTGSIDVLKKVYASDGIMGWYKVYFSIVLLQPFSFCEKKT